MFLASKHSVPFLRYTVGMSKQNKGGRKASRTAWNKGLTAWNKGLRQDIRERFMAFVDKRPNGCWLWTGFRTKRGYGMFESNGDASSNRANRVSYELFVGPIPSGALIIHKCPGGGNPACVNPDHLKASDQLENMDDRKRAGRYQIGKKSFFARNPKVRDAGTKYVQEHPEVLPHGDDHWTRKHPELLKRGADNPRAMAKLTEEQVRSIRDEYKPVRGSLAQLARKYKVSSATIADIVHGRLWVHLLPDHLN